MTFSIRDAHLLITASLLFVGTVASQVGWAQEAGHSDSPAGIYELEATLGENAVPARLELEEAPPGYRGRLTLRLQRPLYFALRSEGEEDSLIVFAASAPATSMELLSVRDTVRGHLHLSGDRTVRLTGVPSRGASWPADLNKHFALSPFAPQSVSVPDRGEAFPTFSPDGRTLYFSVYDTNFGMQTIMVSHFENGRWRRPDTASFSGEFSDRSPAVSPDGERFLFASKRPLPGEYEAKGDYDLWMMTAGPGGEWGTPQPVSTLNSEASDYQPTLAADGTLYFSSERGGSQDLYRSRLGEGGFEEPEVLGEEVNTDESEMSSFISPDERYLIFAASAAHSGHIGNDDLYVSFLRNGRWTTPRSLGLPVNSFANEYGPTVSPDGKYLYFTSDRHPPANIYRVKMALLDIE